MTTVPPAGLSQPPAPDGARVWHFDLDDGRWQDWHGLLSPEEEARATRFVRPLLQQRFRSGRAALRRVLGACLQQDPRSMLITYEPGGKPVLPSNPLHFNLSHSGSHALLAVAHCAVGVDIEQGRPGLTVDGVLQAICSPREWLDVQALPDEARREYLLRLWCHKEAWSKALGLGLQLDWRTIDVLPQGAALHTVRRQDRTWWLYTLDTPAALPACLCAERPLHPIECLPLSPLS